MLDSLILKVLYSLQELRRGRKLPKAPSGTQGMYTLCTRRLAFACTNCDGFRGVL